MKLLLSIFLLLVSASLHSQSFVEKVYLNDSITVYEGLIIEQAPTRYIKIARSREKDTITVYLKDIWKLTKEYPKADTTKRQTSPATKPLSATGKAVYLEALGIGGLYSLNFDTRLVKGKQDGWGIRAGLEYCRVRTINYYGDTLQQDVFGLPLMVNYLLGKGNNFLELGLGVTYFIRRPNGELLSEQEEYTIPKLGIRPPAVLGSMMVGYRYVPEGKGMMFGASFNPLLGNNYGYPSVGLKIGYKFS
ncbi:MAG: hypothetical protein K0Q66_1144 [Chitinophagaceae bacterium]|nr:hypothetical protein [Chitinophagaceae bacterium]